MNVAFRGVDELAQYNAGYTNPSPYPPSGRGAWFEDNQAAALKSGDISAFGYTVSTSDLRPGVTRKATIGPGLHERVYTSGYTVPAESGAPTESMSYVGVKGRGSGGAVTAFAQVFNLLGKYQPYGVYVPRSVTRGNYGVQMEWHGSNQGIVAQINQPGMQKQFGEDLGRLLVTPEARGPNGYGSDVSERDLLDVMLDVARTFPVDTDRAFSSGYSQGGYITFRMAFLYPHLFAGFTGWVPFTGDDTNGLPGQGTGGGVTAGAVGNMVDFAGNARHVPGSMIFGAEDELVPAPSAEAMRQAFDDAGGPYRWWQHLTAEHLTFAALDEWGKEAAYSANQRRVHDPARVTYRTATFLDAPQFGIRHDTAYWISGIRPRAQQYYADTDLTSSGCGAPVVTATETPGAGTVPVPYVQDGRDVAVTRGPAAARLEGSLANVGQLTVDVRRTCLTRAFAYTITSDGPATVTLSDGRVLRLVAGTNTGALPAR
jgi:dienelactone hydrolase